PDALGNDRPRMVVLSSSASAMNASSSVMGSETGSTRMLMDEEHHRSPARPTRRSGARLPDPGLDDRSRLAGGQRPTRLQVVDPDHELLRRADLPLHPIERALVELLRCYPPLLELFAEVVQGFPTARVDVGVEVEVPVLDHLGVVVDVHPERRIDL